LPTAVRPLRSRSRVRVHLGTAEVLARVAVLKEDGEIGAGASGMAQLRLETPVVTLPGDRFILRSYSPQHTIAGGLVLDSLAAKHRGHRERSDVSARLKGLTEALTKADAAGQLTIFVESAGERGLRRAELTARSGWRDTVLNQAAAEAIERGAVVEAEEVYIGQASFVRLVQAAVAEV